MIIPSVDIQNGNAVQLVGGKTLAIDAGAPVPILQKFGKVGEVAVVDLDAAMGTGSNRDQMESMLKIADCRVAGGIRNVDSAIDWLDRGAKKVILGTAAKPEILRQLPRERVMAALDAVHGEDGIGEVVDHGWQKQTGQPVIDRLNELKEHVSGFLITFVEREGQLLGIDQPTIEKYIAAADGVPITVAGGIVSAAEIDVLDKLGVDAQVGMAIYSGKLSLAEAFCAPLNSDRPDGLWPTVVVNENRQSLGLTYSNLESVKASLETGLAHYWSRRRGLWKKGESSGNLQELIGIDTDCDRDCLQFIVRQSGIGFCHLQQTSCFGELPGLLQLQSQLKQRLQSAPVGSYVQKLFDSDELLHAKIEEEARELVEASNHDEVVHEAADVLFFTLAKLVKTGVALEEIMDELKMRSRKVTRRGGQKK